jgi:hypothetical protein
MDGLQSPFGSRAGTDFTFIGVTLISEILPVTVALGGELPSSIMPTTVIHGFWCRGQRMPRPRRLSSISSALPKPAE